MNCSCLWKKSGLGAEVTIVSRSCEVHGVDGPMPMTMRDEIPRDPSLRKLAEVAHGGSDRNQIREDNSGQRRNEALYGNAAGAGKDDRHVFISGAMSSGKKPPYTAITMECLERFANQRGYGDDKYGPDNWMKGAKDKQFILDRINHSIEHLLILASQVKADDPGSIQPGTDDAAAVCCAAMFVMRWQSEMRTHRLLMQSLREAEEARMDTDGFRNGPTKRVPARKGDCVNPGTAIPDDSSYGHGV